MKICKTCNQQFINTIDRTTFCSHKCQAKWAVQIANLTRKPRPKTGRDFNCKVCAKFFYVPQYRIKKGKVKYCSRNCLAKDLLNQYHNQFGFQPLNKPKPVYKCISINGKRVREHRYLMEQFLGRKLEFWEHVHHIDGNSSNNNLENLVVLSNADHQREEYKIRKKITSSVSS